jgi:hypothetical protein
MYNNFHGQYNITSRSWSMASQSKIFRGQTRRVIHNVIIFCDVEKKGDITIPISKESLYLSRNSQILK